MKKRFNISTEKFDFQKTYQIVGNHPHKGEKGHFLIDENNMLTILTFNNVRTYQFVLENCEHGVEGCFVSMKDLGV